MFCKLRICCVIPGDALEAVRAGRLDATVFQDGCAKGRAALDAALALIRGEKVAERSYIPFQLVSELILQFAQNAERSVFC